MKRIEHQVGVDWPVREVHRPRAPVKASIDRPTKAMMFQFFREIEAVAAAECGGPDSQGTQ